MKLRFSNEINKLDIDPRSLGRRCIHDVVIYVHVGTYLNDFCSLAQVKIQVIFQFRIFFKKESNFWWFPFQIFGDFQTFPLIYQLLICRTDILTKLRWFQLFSTSQNTSQNSISIFFKSNFWDLSIYVSITNAGQILTKPGWFLLSGYGQTDRQTDTVLESSYGNMSAHKKKFKSNCKISG